MVYGSARKSYLIKLDTIQNQALWLCLGAFRTSPISSLHVEANELPLHLRREKLALQYAIKLRTTPSNPAYDVTFHPKNGDFYVRKPNAIRSFGFRVRGPLSLICPDLTSVSPCTIPSSPPWKLCQPVVNLSLTKDKKDCTDTLLFRTKIF